tara:strand:- start:1563 stop:1703 length:141 start_codon:yes stop_codon:yes gene_type:complete
MDKEDKEDKELEKEIKQELKVYKERRHKIRVQDALDKHKKNIMGSF